MKHSLHPQRLILAVLLLAALVSSVCAAEVRIGKDSIYCFSAGDFADPARGIYVDAVPSASTGTLCYGDRVLCAGDVLPWPRWARSSSARPVLKRPTVPSPTAPSRTPDSAQWRR